MKGQNKSAPKKHPLPESEIRRLRISAVVVLTLVLGWLIAVNLYGDTYKTLVTNAAIPVLGVSSFIIFYALFRAGKALPEEERGIRR